MMANSINTPNVALSQHLFSGQTSKSSGNSTQETGDFAKTLQLRMAEIKSQTFSTLLSAASGDENSQQDGSSFDSLLDKTGMAENGLSNGRNTALFDPESAYSMMTEINTRDVNYKAEYAEMKDMKSHVEALQKEAQTLAGISGNSSDEEIRARLQDFAAAYNEWIDRFDDEMKPGGLLAGTQAAHVSQWELEQSIENIFFGVRDGMRGMPALGLSTDPVTDMAVLDLGQLDAALASNRNGVIATVQEFSVNFAKSAELLNSEDNFIPNRIDNLGRAIDFIGSNRQSLQAEFGLGDAARPSGKVAQGLASYNAIYAMG